MKNKYPLMGERVLVNYYYEKEYSEGSNEDTEVVTWVRQRFEDTKVGWVTGYRKKFNGVRQYIDGDYSKFIPTETVDCLMVALSPLQNSITVPIDSVIKEPKNFEH